MIEVLNWIGIIALLSVAVPATIWALFGEPAPFANPAFAAIAALAHAYWLIGLQAIIWLIILLVSAIADWRARPKPYPTQPGAWAHVPPSEWPKRRRGPRGR